MIEFHAEGWYDIEGRGKCAATKNDRWCYDWSRLIGKDVSIDGVVYRCKGVERFAVALPYPEGFPIGLWVETP